MVKWYILTLVLVGDILFLLLVKDNNTRGAGGKGHITYFDLYIYYRATDAVWLKKVPRLVATGAILREEKNA